MTVFNENLFISYHKCDDLFLLNLVKKNKNTSAEYCLIDRYKRLVKMKARTYFLIGADVEDVIQEGMIGLYKAVHNYDNTKVTSFKIFAEICIIRQIITAIKKASRKKRKLLHDCISLDQPIYCKKNGNQTLLDVVSDFNINDPMSVFLSKERWQELKEKLNNMLSILERKVLEAYLDGRSYKDIAREIKRDYKSVDNAIQRIKKKLEFINNLN